MPAPLRVKLSLLEEETLEELHKASSVPYRTRIICADASIECSRIECAPILPKYSIVMNIR